MNLIWKSFGAMLLLVLSGPAWADNFDVICAGGVDPGGNPDYATIQDAVNAALAVSPDGPHTINVSGNCEGFAKVNGMDNLEIRGTPAVAGTPDDSLTNVVGPRRATLFVANSRNFLLRDMTVVGFSDAPDAISFTRAEGELETCVVQGAERHGINVGDNSSLSVNNTTVQNNGSGIGVNNLSSVRLFNTKVLNNSGFGLNISNASLATLSGDDTNTVGMVEKNEIANNGGDGINVGGLSNLVGGSGAHLIHHNGFRGITVGSGSNANLSGQSATEKLEIYQNGFQGVRFTRATGSLGSFTKVYQNNQNPPSPLPPGSPFLCGVCASSGSNVVLAETEISGDPGHGLFVHVNSSANARSVTITGNTGDGVHVEKGSGGHFNPPQTSPPGTPTNISGNTGDSVKCTDPLSWISGDLTGIAKPIKCTILK